ncbi:MAG: hypothetical protein M3451_12225, partial [Chloroflexota bacterium]|nr:hypothetical protein [Chloroflexota bacterium]
MIIELLLAATMAQAAADACSAPSGAFTVSSGAPFTVTWVVPATAPTSATDPTPVPNRINGFNLQIDSGVKQNIGLPTAGPACPAGTAHAGKIPYSYRTTSGVAKGSHTLSLSAWNYALDASGNPTTTQQESAAVSVPFAVVDLVQTGPPVPPVNV